MDYDKLFMDYYSTYLDAALRPWITKLTIKLRLMDMAENNTAAAILKPVAILNNTDVAWLYLQACHFDHEIQL